jgi:hypothetical protein
MIFWQRFLFVISIRHGGTLGTPPSLWNSLISRL